MSLLVPLVARQYSDLPTTTRVEVLLIKKKFFFQIIQHINTHTDPSRFNIYLYVWMKRFLRVSFNETIGMNFAELCQELYVMKANLMSETS